MSTHPAGRPTRTTYDVVTGGGRVIDPETGFVDLHTDAAAYQDSVRPSTGKGHPTLERDR